MHEAARHKVQVIRVVTTISGRLGCGLPYGPGSIGSTAQELNIRTF